MGKTLKLRTSVDVSVTMTTSVLLKSYYNHSSLSDSMVQDERDINRPFKTYTIPRKERRPSEDCQFTLPVDSREAKEIEHAVRRLTWDTNDLDRAVSISHIKKVDNPNLEREYHEKKATLREEGRSPKELTQQLAFCVETEDSRVKDICRLGLECEGENHTLGDGSMGVTVWKCPDLCLRALNWPSSGTAYLVVFKIVKGRVKSVTPKLSPETPNLEPTPNCDCHVSRNPASTSVTDLPTLMRSTQYYLYEYDDEGLPSKRPRHCLPFAVILLKKNVRTASPMKPPLSIPIEKPTSPLKESSKLSEDMKTPSFSDDDGILAWRGLVTSNEKSLGCVSLLAGHKLGFNFWKSYLDVSRKIPLKQLGTMLPGDIKSAWKSPLLYRNHVLSLCTMKPTPRQPSETLSSFTRHLAVKAKSAGVLSIDSFTTMFLVPSSKLTVHLGFCTAEKPPKMFCIVCRRQSALLSPTSVWPLASPVTSPGDCRSASFSITGTPAGTVGASIRPASLDLKAHHKAKIVVSSPENNHRLSPKQVHPRHIAKRSLSFPFSPSNDGSKRLLRVSRSASISGNDGFPNDSTTKPIMLSRRSIDLGMHRSSTESLGDDSRAFKDESSDKRPNSNENSLLYLNSESSREKDQVEPFYNGLNREQAKNTPNLNGVSNVSVNTQTSLTPELVPVQISHLGTSKTCSNISEKPDCGNRTLDKPFDLQINRKASTKVQEFEHFSPRTRSKPSILTYDLEKRHLTAREDPVTPSAIDLSSSNSFPVHRVVERAHLAMKDSPLPPLAVEPLSSPTTRGFSPFWPDSPIVFSSASDRIPFLSNTPVNREGPPDKEKPLSLKHKDNSCLDLSQPGDELFGNGTTPNLTTRMDEAVSASRDLGESPFGVLEKKNSHSTSLDLENWSKTLSFLNDKQALRSLRRAAAHHKSPKLNKNTESCDNLQAIDMEVSEPSEIDPSGLFNEGAVDTLSKEDTRTRVSQLHDDLQTVDMEISESPQCPIVLGHASSCTPSVPLSNSTSRHSKLNAASLSVFSDVGNDYEEGAGSNDGKTSHQTELNSKNSSEHSDARVGESFARDEKALAEISSTENADVDSKILESGDIVEPVNIDIADDLELLSNGAARENDSTTQPTPTEMAQVLNGCNTESSEKPLLPSKMTNVSSKSSLAPDTNTSQQTVPGISTTTDDAEVTASEATTDQSAAKLPSKKRLYSCLVSSLDQDTDNSVPKDLRQNQDQTMLSKISDASTEKTCSLNDNSPIACTLTNRVAVGFILSPKKSSKVCTQDALATNCDQSCLRASDVERGAELSSVTPCKSSPRSSPESDSKLETKEFEERQELKSNDDIDRPSSDDFEIKDKRNDYKPLAVNCTAFTRDASYFPEHTESQLGGVIETSLFQDWGLLQDATDSNKLHVRKEDSFVVEEHDECTEVADFGSEADQVLQPIERWPVIEYCDTLEPETVICSPMNSIETFTFRFPGECGFNEDTDTVSATEITTTEEETILVEERFRGVCQVPEVVICSDGNSEEMTTSDDILPRIVPTDRDNESPYLCKDLKTSGSQCEDTQASNKVASVMPVLHTSVAELHIDELLNKRGSFCEDSNDLKGSCLIEQQFIRTDNCTEGCSDSPAPQSLETSIEEAVIQTKQPEVSPTLESEKEDVASPVLPKPGICCTEALNTLSIPSVETTINVALPTSVPQLSVDPRKDTTPTVKIGDHSSKMNEIRPGNAVGDGKKVVNCLDKLPCPKEVNEIKRQGEKEAEKLKAANLPCPSESLVHVQEKGRDGNSAEYVQEINFPKELQETRADPKQKTVNSSCTEPAALPVNCIADKLKLKSSSESKQFTAMLNKETSAELDSATSTRNSIKRNCGEVNSGTESTAVKDVFAKSVEPRAKIVKHDKFVEETTMTTAETLCVTASQPRFSKKPAESYTKEGKAKDARSGTSLDMHSRGRSEPLRDINDLQRDTKALTGKRKHATEPENVTKQAKLTPVPFLVNAGEGVKHDHVPSEKSRELSFGDYPHYTERGQCKYSQGDYHKAVQQQYSYPRWMAPALPTHLPVRNGERGGLPNLVPNDPPWYQPRGVINQNQFQQVYTRLPECGRPTYFSSVCKVRPMFAPTPAVPTTWSLPGNFCPVPYPIRGPR